jgi:hypothetical protein
VATALALIATLVLASLLGPRVGSVELAVLFALMISLAVAIALRRSRRSDG